MGTNLTREEGGKTKRKLWEVRHNEKRKENLDGKKIPRLHKKTISTQTSQ